MRTLASVEEVEVFEAAVKNNEREMFLNGISKKKSWNHVMAANDSRPYLLK